MKIFICSKLADPDHRQLNEEIYELCHDLGFSVFLPQNELPPGTELSPLQILEANERAVDDADIILAVFDHAEAGIGMELERAHLLKKRIAAFRSKESVAKEDLGKMLEGAWERIPEKEKVHNIPELKEILQRKNLKRNLF